MNRGYMDRYMERGRYMAREMWKGTWKGECVQSGFSVCMRGHVTLGSCD
jgi:hypothetical protein